MRGGSRYDGIIAGRDKAAIGCHMCHIDCMLRSRGAQRTPMETGFGAANDVKGDYVVAEPKWQRTQNRQQGAGLFPNQSSVPRSEPFAQARMNLSRISLF